MNLEEFIHLLNAAVTKLFVNQSTDKSVLWESADRCTRFSKKELMISSVLSSLTLNDINTTLTLENT
jgi:hypothetical protein